MRSNVDWLCGMTNCFLEKKNECLHTFQGLFLQLINGVFKTDTPIMYLLVLKFAFIFFLYHFEKQYT